MVELKFLKTHPDAELPTQNHSTYGECNDTGYDIKAVETVTIGGGNSAIIAVGLTVAYITPGYWFKIEARSGLGFKYSVVPHPGIIDNMYRGDLSIKLYNNSSNDYKVKKGDKIAQIVIYPLINATCSFSTVIEETGRMARGFGSSDVNIS